MIQTALTIAGSDPSGGAGIQADLKTFQAFGVYGMSVVTAITAQNTREVSRVEPVSSDMVEEQLRMVVSDIVPGAVKTGMLSTDAIVHRTAERLSSLSDLKLIIDPVIASSSGKELLDRKGVAALKTKLIPMALLITPNLQEAEILSGIRIDSVPLMKQAALEIRKLGAAGVLVTGGHLDDEAADVLLWEDEILIFSSDKVESRSTHGTGCTLSAAVTAGLALGKTLPQAVEISKMYVFEAIRSGLNLGGGNGPLNHFIEVD